MLSVSEINTIIIKDKSRYRESFEKTQAQLLENILSRLNKLTGNTQEVQSIISLVMRVIENTRIPQYRFIDLHYRIILVLWTLPIRVGQGIDWLWDSSEFLLQHNIQFEKESSPLLILQSKILATRQEFETAKRLGWNAWHAAIYEKNIKYTVESAIQLVNIYTKIDGNFKNAAKILTNIEAYLQKQPDPNIELRMRLNLRKVEVYRRLGRLEELGVLLDEIKNDLESRNYLDYHSLAVGHHVIGLVLCWTFGDYANALFNFKTASKAFTEGGEITNAAGTQADLALAYWNMGNYQEAEKHLNSANKVIESSGDFHRSVKILGYYGLLYLGKGKLNKALGFLEKQRAATQNLNLQTDFMRATGNRGIVNYHLGNYIAALSDLEMDFKYAQSNIEASSHAKLQLARCWNALGNHSKALQLVEEVLQQAEALGILFLKALGLRLMGELHPDRAIATKALVAAKNLTENKRLLDEAAICFWLAKYALNNNEALRYWMAGKTILQRIGASAWLRPHHTLHNPPEIALL